MVYEMTKNKIYACPCGSINLRPTSATFGHKVEDLYVCDTCGYTNTLNYMILHPLSWLDKEKNPKSESRSNNSKMPVKQWAIYQLLCAIANQTTESPATAIKYKKIAQILWQAQITNKTVRDMAKVLGVKVYKTEPKKKG